MGFYYKPDVYRNGIQGGSSPYEVAKPASEVKIDPYGHKSGKNFSLGLHLKINLPLHWLPKQFDGCHTQYKRQKAGGIGCVTPDRFPVFDHTGKMYIL